MAFIHGRNSIVKVGANDLSAFTNNTAFNRAGDTHDTTTYGQTGHTYAGGLTDGTITLAGIYDSAVGGPRKVLDPLLAATVAFVWQPEGAGTGKPNVACSTVVGAYEETSPVADMIAWTATFQISGPVTTTTLP